MFICPYSLCIFCVYATFAVSAAVSRIVRCLHAHLRTLCAYFVCARICFSLYFCVAFPQSLHLDCVGLSALTARASRLTDLRDWFGLCKTPSSADVGMLKYFVRDAFDTLAMGNYPWPSSYIAGSLEVLAYAHPIASVLCVYLLKKYHCR
jgi:hypothetical protein